MGNGTWSMFVLMGETGGEGEDSSKVKPRLKSPELYSWLHHRLPPWSLRTSVLISESHGDSDAVSNVSEKSKYLLMTQPILGLDKI